MMDRASIIKFDEVVPFNRGDGVETRLLVGVEGAPGTVFTPARPAFRLAAPPPCTATIAASR